MISDKKIRVAIIDYELGNMFSVKKACDIIGLDSTITTDKHVLMNSDAAILPGVGAFGDAMNNLHRLDLVEPIKDFIQSKKQFFGVCLGFQLLFSESEEFGAHGGLGIIDGTVKKFFRNDIKIKVPQIGWNHARRSPFITNEIWNDSPLKNINTEERMYFVHSYSVAPSDSTKALTYTIYEGIEYCSSVFLGNVFATQFHPEKSSKEGLKIYSDWSTKINEPKKG